MRHSVKDAAFCVTRNVCAVCLSSGISTCCVGLFCRSEMCRVTAETSTSSFLSRRMPTKNGCLSSGECTSFCNFLVFAIFYFGGLFCESIRLFRRNLHDEASCGTYRNVCTAVEHTEISALQWDTQTCAHCIGTHRNVCIAVGQTEMLQLQWDNRNVAIAVGQTEMSAFQAASPQAQKMTDWCGRCVCVCTCVYMHA